MTHRERDRAYLLGAIVLDGLVEADNRICCRYALIQPGGIPSVAGSLVRQSTQWSGFEGAAGAFFLFILTPSESATAPTARESPAPAEAAWSAGAAAAVVSARDVAVRVAETLEPLDWAVAE